MIRNGTTGGTLVRPPSLFHDRFSPVALYQRLAEGWRKARSRTPLERAIDLEVRRHLAHRPVEPGDAVIVNRIVEEISRRSVR